MSLNIVRTPAGPDDGSHHARGLGDCQEVLAHATSPWSTHAPGFAIALFVFSDKREYLRRLAISAVTLKLWARYFRPRWSAVKPHEPPTQALPSISL